MCGVVTLAVFSNVGRSEQSQECDISDHARGGVSGLCSVVTGWSFQVITNLVTETFVVFGGFE